MQQVEQALLGHLGHPVQVELGWSETLVVQVEQGLQVAQVLQVTLVEQG